MAPLSVQRLRWLPQAPPQPVPPSQPPARRSPYCFATPRWACCSPSTRRASRCHRSHHREPPLPGTGEALRIATTLLGVCSKKTTPHQATHQEVTDGSVHPSTGSAEAAGTALELGASWVCCLPITAHCRAGRTAPHCGPSPGAGTQDRKAVILMDSRPALLRLQAADQPSSSTATWS